LTACPNDGAWAKVVVDALADAIRGPGEDRWASGREYSIADEARSIGTYGLALEWAAIAEPVLRGGALGSVCGFICDGWGEELADDVVEEMAL